MSKESQTISATGYTVYDEMSCTVLLKTEDKKKAVIEAYNNQCVLFFNGELLKDFSC